MISDASLNSGPSNNTITSLVAILKIAIKNITNETTKVIFEKKDLSPGFFSNFSYATGVQKVEKLVLNTITKATNLIAAAYRPSSSKSLHCLRAILSNDWNSHVIKIVSTNGEPYLIISNWLCLTFLTTLFDIFQIFLPK